MGVLSGNRTKYASGEVYSYTSGGKTYGIVFLYEQRGYHLIALSEALPQLKKAVTVEAILRAPLYTVAWFSDVDMLPARRLHVVGTAAVAGDFRNRAGLHEDENGIVLKNVGQGATWKHGFRAFALDGVSVGEVLTAKYLPKTRP